VARDDAAVDFLEETAARCCDCSECAQIEVGRAGVGLRRVEDASTGASELHVAVEIAALIEN
jgi:hypothetical protein